MYIFNLYMMAQSVWHGSSGSFLVFSHRLWSICHSFILCLYQLIPFRNGGTSYSFEVNVWRIEKTRETTLYEVIRLGRDSRACVGVATRTIKSNKELLYRYSRPVWKQLITPQWRRGHLSCKIAGMFSILFLMPHVFPCFLS